MNIRDDISADFCLEIDYIKGSTNPARVFRAMGDLIETSQQIDLTLVNSIDNKIQPILLLEDIETSSIKAWLRNVLESTDDDALKNLDWKKQVGKYLVKSKYFLVSFLKDKTEITDKKQLYEAQSELLKLAEETEVRKFPAYTPITPQKLIESIDLLNKSLKNLDPNDTVKFISDEGEVNFNLGFDFVPDKMQELLTKESISSTQEMILKVKKPDYLGDSKWDFKHEKSLSAKILHIEWLNDFQNRKLDVRPGDSLKAKVKITVNYGYDNEVINTVYEIIEIVKIIQDNDNMQVKLDLPD